MSTSDLSVIFFLLPRELLSFSFHRCRTRVEGVHSPENVHVCVNRVQAAKKEPLGSQPRAVARRETRNGDFIVPSLGRVIHGDCPSFRTSLHVR